MSKTALCHPIVGKASNTKAVAESTSRFHSNSRTANTLRPAVENLPLVFCERVGVWRALAFTMQNARRLSLPMPLSKERWIERGYIDGADAKAPAVSHLNGVVANLALAEIHNYITPFKEFVSYLTYNLRQAEAATDFDRTMDVIDSATELPDHDRTHGVREGQAQLKAKPTLVASCCRRLSITLIRRSSPLIWNSIRSSRSSTASNLAAAAFDPARTSSRTSSNPRPTMSAKSSSFSSTLFCFFAMQCFDP
jgi:hypothetical protein